MRKIFTISALILLTAIFIAPIQAQTSSLSGRWEGKTVSPQVAQDVSWADVRRLLTLVASDPRLFSFATPDETNGFSSSPTVTPTMTVTVTPAPKITVTPGKAKVSIKVNGAGAVRTINLVAPPVQ